MSDRASPNCPECHDSVDRRDFLRRQIRRGDRPVAVHRTEEIEGNDLVEPPKLLCPSLVPARADKSDMRVGKAIADLPQDTRTVFLLHRFRDLTYPQIAEIMSLSGRTVARKMAEAIERLSAAVSEAT